MITSYATLQSTIESYLHRSDLTSFVTQWIAAAEERIYNTLRITAMEASFSEAISSGVVNIPTGFLEWKYLYANTSPVTKLEKRDAEWIYTQYPTRSAEGCPKFFAREVSTVIFAPYPDSAYTIKGVYYKRLTALSDSNTTNWFIQNCPEILLFGALCESYIYTKDDSRSQMWEPKFEALRQRLQETDKRESRFGSQLMMRAG